MSSRFHKWLTGDYDVMEKVYDIAEARDMTREQMKKKNKEAKDKLDQRREVQRAAQARTRGFYHIYIGIAIVSCITLVGVLLFCIANLPRYGVENPRTVEVVKRYVEKGLEETGAVNVVAGLILDYRAFDTLGESHVLFTALVCVMVLLRLDQKNMTSRDEDYYLITSDKYYRINQDPILRTVCFVLLPGILIFGIYILLNGQNGPGGGFSGGTVMGTALIIFAEAFGWKTVDKFFSKKRLMIITFISLGFYAFAKGYVFFTGSNHMENIIPKGTPGAILSGGLILPLDIAVGMVVACTMFGFYSLFMRGTIGGND